MCMHVAHGRMLESVHVLSAREPTMVPKIMEEPKPAMNRRPMSPLSKP